MAISQILDPPRAGERVSPDFAEIERTQRRLRRLAVLLDGAIRIPGTGIRLGADSLIGLMPGIGDVVTLGLSAYIVREAHRVGAPRSLLVTMARNVAIDTAIGLVPLVGDVADVFFKANLINLALLDDYLATARAGHARVINPSPQARASKTPARSYAL